MYIYTSAEVALGLSAKPKTNITPPLSALSASIQNASELFLQVTTPEGPIPLPPFTLTTIPLSGNGPLSVIVTAVGTSSAAYPNPYVDIEYSEVAVPFTMLPLPGSLVQLTGSSVSLTGSSATIGETVMHLANNWSGIDGASWAPVVSIGDDVSGGNTGAVGPLAFNESSWDRVRNNTQGTLLASAARTATATSPTMTNYNTKGILVFLSVTVASGTGGLSVRIIAIDPVSGGQWYLNPAPTAITTTGASGYMIYPGAIFVSGSTVSQVIQQPLPRTWYVEVVAGDASSYTYSVGYGLIN